MLRNTNQLFGIAGGSRPKRLQTKAIEHGDGRTLIAHGTLVGVDHPGRAFLALTGYYRNEGLVKDERSQKLVDLVDKDMLKRARILGAAFRAAHMVSAAMPGVLTNTPITYEGNRLVWTLPEPYSNLEGERVERRFKDLANLLDREAEIRVGSAFQLAAS